ncbi:GNAT family N-acetyltransferase [Paraglaciecola aestuariivivens]
MKIPVNNQIHLALLVPEFAESLYSLTNKNRQYLKNWLSWLDLVNSLQDTQTFIETAIYHHNHNQGSSFAIFYQEKMVGVAGFNHIDHQHHWGAIGYWLDQEHTGKGIITQSVIQLIKYGFIEHQLDKIEIRCAEQNHKSRQIPERLGFTYEATLRQCEWLYNHYVDHAVYSLLRSEFRG